MTTSRITPYRSGEGRIMVTDKGQHPPEFCAQVTAEHIVPISDNMTGPRRFAALQLQQKIATALLPHHQSVQADEKSKLAASPDHVNNPVNPEDYLDAAMTSVQEAAKGTEWEKHLTFGHSEPAWLKSYQDQVAELGADNVEPLTPEMQADLNSWNRQQMIRSEIGRHFATAQFVAKSWHRNTNGKAA